MISRSARDGFTIIELVLSMVILTTILGLTVPFFRDFRTNQELEQAVQTVKTSLRFAQSQAFGGVKPTACTTTLLGWYIKMQNNATSYQVYYRCGDGLKGETRISNPYKDPTALPQGMTITVFPDFDVLFQPVNKGTVFIANAETQDPPYTSREEMDITLTKGTRTATVTVRTTGDIE